MFKFDFNEGFKRRKDGVIEMQVCVTFFFFFQRNDKDFGKIGLLF